MSRFGSFGGIARHKSNDGALDPDLSGAFCVVLQRWRRWRRGARLLQLLLLLLLLPRLRLLLHAMFWDRF
jgi:hypothetical protein